MGGGDLIHATSVTINGRAVLLTGRSGSGKSDLAIRLIDRGALLISDDYTRIELRDGLPRACPSERIAGKIELRGVGIIDMPFADGAPVALIIDLDAEPIRLPEDVPTTTDLMGIAVPVIALAAFEASAPIKTERALILHGLGVPA